MALLDPAQLDAMASGRPELLLPIVSDFETHGREQLSNLHAALTQGRLEDGKSILHQLKGASGTMGMIRFEELCRECEEQVTAGRVPPRFAELGPLLLESVAGAGAHLRGEAS
ncbi:MAG: hypothetical protein CMN05_02695 [Roseibacillus sp.]|nr:hypothetical protein [Roseibacillus sp.]MBP35302.1 hypothetical protein [Roseibacillus sp.]MCP4729124.1 hypothetical protein [Roseibacillus sp.]MDP6206685.1 Hpt domain-containing protein [Roseibacillus sp.]MDP7308945.1 Hpt domain-containing protein [Roseibacillus sp.]